MDTDIHTHTLRAELVAIVKLILSPASTSTRPSLPLEPVIGGDKKYSFAF